MPLCTIFTKWPAPFGAAVQVALLGGAAGLLAARRARDVADARAPASRRSGRGAAPPPPRRRSSCSSRARGPTRRRWCRRRRSGCPSAPAPWRGGCRRCSSELPPSIRMSPGSSSGSSSAIVWSTTAAGTISQTARGFVELRHEVGERRRAGAPSPAPAPATACGDMSKTTHSWPPLIRRRTMFAPIRPRPIIPSCMSVLLCRVIVRCAALGSARAVRACR